ncbi:MAG: transglutaminase family protein [Acidimicrobiales bacterium]
MSWKVGIRHTSGYRYRGDVWASYNEARVTPLTTDRQVVLEAQIQVSPSASTYRYWDYWGTLVDAFEVHGTHTALHVTSTSVVETPIDEPAIPATTWDAVHERPPAERLDEMLAPSGFVPRIPEVADAMEPLAGAAAPAEAVAAAMAWVGDRLRYERGTTDVTTTAADALRLGVGVCQDYAHLALSALRGLGIPARYVSGYLHPDPDAEVGAVVEGQSHAWVEAWLGTWLGLDPTHGGGVGERHVVVARGRDYADVLPLKGVYHGGPSEALTVAVEFTRLA